MEQHADSAIKTNNPDIYTVNPEEIPHHPTIRTDLDSRKPVFLFMLIAAAGYFILAKFGIAIFALKPDNITLLWLPSGIALVMCLHWRYKALPLIFVASFAANIEGLGGINNLHAVLHTIVSALVDSLAGFIACILFRRYLPKGLSDTRDLLPFVLAVCLVTTAVTSAMLAANLVWGQYIELSESLHFVKMLVLADSLGILLIFPVYQGWRNGIDLTPKHGKWIIGGIAALMLIFLSTWAGLYSALYFIPPVLLLVSFNSDLFGTGMLTAVSMSLVTALTAHDIGPLVTGLAIETNSRLGAFLFASALTILGMALQHRQLLITELLTQSWQDAAKTDPLTGVFNRRAFFSLSQQESSTGKAGNAPQYSIALLDLDHFKKVNDSYGHAAGDTVLAHFSTLLKAHCRDIDVPARLGGEEFAVFLPNCKQDEAVMVMKRFCSVLQDSPVKTDGHEISVTVSIGVSACLSGDKTDSLNSVLSRADKGLYHAKATGRNKVSTV